MTTPLACLLGFAAWAALLLIAIAVWRSGLVLKGVKRSNEFPSGVPHGGDLYWRLNRAHVNALEMLVIFAVVVLVGAVAQVTAPMLSVLALCVLAGRIIQSIVHVSSGGALAVNLRFTAFLVQLVSIVWMGVLTATA